MIHDISMVCGCLATICIKHLCVCRLVLPVLQLTIIWQARLTLSGHLASALVKLTNLEHVCFPHITGNRFVDPSENLPAVMCTDLYRLFIGPIRHMLGVSNLIASIYEYICAVYLGDLVLCH